MAEVTRASAGYHAVDRGYPEDERFGLAAQTRGAARGFREPSSRERADRDIARFLDISSGSASELEYWRRVALDLIDRATHDPLRARLQEIRRMLYAFGDYLRQSDDR